MGISNTTVLTRKGQTTIPVELRDRLGLKEGDHLVWQEDNGRLSVMEARAYTDRMIEQFKERRKATGPTLSIEEINEAANQAWGQRYERGITEE